MTEQAGKLEFVNNDGPEAESKFNSHDKGRAFYIIALLGVVLGLLAVHCLGLTAAPPGFFSDEASVGYNAYAISLDGRDEYGESWPLFFRAFGEHKNPVTIYLIACVMRFWGPSVTAVRLVPSLLSFVTAAVLGLLIRRLFSNRWLGLGAFAVTGVLPWLFVVGRIGFEVAALPATLSLFLLTWWRAQQASRTPASIGYAFLAGFWLAVSIYSYTTARLFILMLLGTLWIAYLGHWRRHWRPLASVTLISILAYVPLAFWTRAHPGQLTRRFEDLSIFCRPASKCNSFPYFVSADDDHRPFPLVVTSRFLRSYSTVWSPNFLFYSGDPFGRHVTGHGGMLFIMLAPPIAVGIISLWRFRRLPFWRFIGLSMLLAPVPAALTMHLGHALRTIEVVPFLAMVSALGAMELWHILRERRWIAIGLTAALALEMGIFLEDYFSSYPSRQAAWFNPGLEAAIGAARITPHRGPIRISDRIDNGVLMYTFFTGEDPRIYRAHQLSGGEAQLVAMAQAELPSETVVIVKPEESIGNAELIQTVTFPNVDGWGNTRMEPVYRIWRTR